MVNDDESGEFGVGDCMISGETVNGSGREVAVGRDSSA